MPSIDAAKPIIFAVCGLQQFGITMHHWELRMLPDFDINNIVDQQGNRDIVVVLLNLVENLNQENHELKEQNQSLKDEINRLKGEQGKPKITPNKSVDSDDASASSNTNHSSEKERTQKKKWKKRSKKDRITINETKLCPIDKETLPADAKFKRYVDVVVQDVIFQPHNICFQKEQYYSSSTKKTYLAGLPTGYYGEYGPGIKALAVTLSELNVSQPKILQLFADIGIIISTGQLSNFLIKKQDTFHNEKDAIYKAGVKSTAWQHIDDTSTRVNGKNQYCQIVCNPFYTAYFTTEKKNRLTIINTLLNAKENSYYLNQTAYDFLYASGMPEKVIATLKDFPQEQVFNENEFPRLVNKFLFNLGPRQRSLVLDAGAISFYHAQTDFPIIRTLLCDDAPQFKEIVKELSLCWVHDGRHYKKLSPFMRYHQKLIDNFLGKYWDYYHQLLDYKKHPTSELADTLETKFDDIFSMETGYDALDQRIAKTKAKKQSLLWVLKYPDIPLHNNPAELGARRRVRKRDVSFTTRNKDGTKALDTFSTIGETAKKLGVSFYHYIYDRISGKYEMPSLAEIIAERAKQYCLPP